MSIVSAKCTCCGAEITVDDSKEALICEKCNSPFIVEKAIELYISEKETPEFETVDGVLKKYNGDSENVTVPDNVTKIGGGAFFKKYSLKSVVIPEGVKEIGDYAFAYCESLSKVTCPDCDETDVVVVFPRSLQYLGDHSFRGCTSLPPAIVFQNKDRIYHNGNPVFRHCFEDENEVVVMQKGHRTPHMYSSLGTFDMELSPLSNYLFGNDFIKDKVKYRDGRDKADIEKQEKLKQSSDRYSQSGSSSGSHRVHRSGIWKKNGLCAHCGGSFNLLKKCRVCGMKKDY